MTVVGNAWRVASYRFRVTFGRRWVGLLAIVMLIGLMGGVALGSLAGARRTQSSYPRFLASTNPSDLTVTVFDASGGASVDLTARLRHLPNVARVASLDETTHFALLRTNGAPDVSRPVAVISSADGELFRQDRVAAVRGRLPDLRRADEVVLTASAARQAHAALGRVVHFGFFTTSSARTPSFRADVRVVGIVVFNDGVVQDDVDAQYGFVVATPALLREAIAKLPVTAVPFTYGLQLTHGQRDVATVEREVVAALPGGVTHEFHATAPVVSAVEEATRPESIALGAFGLIALLVTLVIGAQAVARQLRAGNEDRSVLRALGATRGVASADGLIGVLLAVILGSVAAVVIAVALSPLTPLGPVRAVYPASGFSIDWAVVGVGFATLTVILGVAAVTIAVRQTHRVEGRLPRAARRSRAAIAATDAGLPTPTVMGIGYALERGAGRATVPVRAALLGAVFAVATVAATLTFASSLNTLVSRPRLYGWNWTYMINPSQAVPPITRTLLARDHDVEWSAVDYDLGVLDGQTVPTLLANPGSTIAPPVLTGHGLEADNQIVVGKETLARLHKHVGQTVVFTYGTSRAKPSYIPPRTLRIVGTATFPAIGYLSFVADHTSMGTGALLPIDVRPPAFQKAFANPDPLLDGPDLAFVRVRPGVSPNVARAGLERIVRTTDKTLNADPAAAGNNITLVSVQRPAQIVNYRSVGAAPELLAVGLALGTVFALGLMLTASVRRRRRELALLKTLGFTRRQLAVTVAAQATVIAVIGIVVGIPTGIMTGRWLWTLFARAISAVPQPTVPAMAIVAVTAGTVVLANLVAAIPGRLAARTPAALLLQTE